MGLASPITCGFFRDNSSNDSALIEYCFETDCPNCLLFVLIHDLNLSHGLRQTTLLNHIMFFWDHCLKKVHSLFSTPGSLTKIHWPMTAEWSAYHQARTFNVSLRLSAGHQRALQNTKLTCQASTRLRVYVSSDIDLMAQNMLHSWH